MCSDGSGVLEILFLGTFDLYFAISTLNFFQIWHKFGKK